MHVVCVNVRGVCACACASGVCMHVHVVCVHACACGVCACGVCACACINQVNEMDMAATWFYT